jgi:hypothetical protein
VKKIQTAALNKIGSAGQLVKDIHALDASGNYEKPLYEREVVTNACFLNVFIALEEFFEASFGHYAMGRMSTASWRPSKFARPPSVAHAQEMFIGIQRFMDWSTPDHVVKLAKLYFAQGEPFVLPISSSKSQLDNMKTVRNATAHLSRTTQASLDAAYSRWTGAPVIGVNTYQMLMALSPSTSQTFYGASEQTVLAIVRQVSAHH